jgi:hypothetical protein
MPENGNKSELPNDRQKGHCPVCGEKADDVTKLPERIEAGERTRVPGMHYDHGSNTCIEWADGETEQN